MVVSLLKGDGLYEKANYCRDRHYRLCRAVCRCVATKRRGGELLAEPVKTAVNAEIEARSEKTPNIFISEVTPAPEVESIVKVSH